MGLVRRVGIVTQPCLRLRESVYLPIHSIKPEPLSKFEIEIKYRRKNRQSSKALRIRRILSLPTPSSARTRPPSLSPQIKSKTLLSTIENKERHQFSNPKIDFFPNEAVGMQVKHKSSVLIFRQRISSPELKPRISEAEQSSSPKCHTHTRFRKSDSVGSDSK